MAERKVSGSRQWNLERVYESFPVLKDRSRQGGSLLSGGEQQMLAISRALMTSPTLLLMDEPSEGLSPLIVEEVGRIVSEVKESGMSILLVEQNLGMAMAVADYVYILSKGRVVYEGTPGELEKNETIRDTHLGLSA